jgi:hypothetical protein
MSQIRQKFGSTLMNTAMQASRHGGHAAAVSTKVVAKPDEANHLTVNWLRRLQQTATTPDAREAHSQLASILDFYNIEKKAKEQASIDWQGFKDRIHTDGVVDKIHAKYDKFMASEYSVDSAVGRVGLASEKIKALDTALQYNFMLYFVHYSQHLTQLETMHNIGDINQMSLLEFNSLDPESETLEMCEREIGNIAPDSYVEDGYYTRICTQFNWGTRYTPPFCHSQDAINCVTATLGKMGQ